MRSGPFLGLLFFAARLFAAASGSTTAIDNAGNVWRTGTIGFLLTSSNAFQKTATSLTCGSENLSPFQPPTPIDCTHAYLKKLDPAGNVLYSSYLAGISQDGGTAITTDAQGSVYVTGYTYSTDFPVTTGVVQPKNAGPTIPATYTSLGAPFGPTWVVPGGDIFVSKFASDGTLLFSTLLGGSGSDIPLLIDADSAGNVYISGVTQSQDFPLATNTATNNFFIRLNPTGTAITYSTYFASQILAFDVDSHGRAYLAGNHQDITILDTSTGATVKSVALTALEPGLTGSGSAIALSPSGNLIVGVSPAPQPYVFNYYPYPPARVPGDSGLLTLSADASTVLAETDIAQSLFDSILFDPAGNAYAFGHGTGAIPKTPIQLLAAPCSEDAASFVVETDPAGKVVTATYFRQGDDSAVAVTATNHLVAFRASSSTTLAIDLSAQPANLFGCPANLASNVSNFGIAPGEILLLTGTGLGPAQGIGAVPDSTGLYPTTLGGVQVLFDSKPVPLLYVSATEIHAVAPFSIYNPVIELQLGSQKVAALDERSSTVNPGIFAVNGQGAIINQDGTVNSPANPAKLGSIVSVYCTGTGILQNPVVDGSVTPIPPPFNVTQLAYPELRFAGVAGITLWSGAAPGIIEGVTQINVQLPAALPASTTLSAVPVVLNAAGEFSPSVLISVKP